MQCLGKLGRLSLGHMQLCLSWSRKSVAGWAWMLLLHCCWCLVSASQEGAREVNFSHGATWQKNQKVFKMLLRCHCSAGADVDCDPAPHMHS